MSLVFLYVVLIISINIKVQAGRFLERYVDTFDGMRTFWVFEPSILPNPSTPVVFVFHGDGGTANGIANATGFNTHAETYGFIVVYPQASMVGAGVRFNTYVDQEPGHAGFGLAQCPDDLEFTQAIMTWLSSTYSNALQRVYATGHSGGGFMCYNLALQMRSQFTAIAPVSASMWGDDNFISAKITSGAWTPLPVMHIHGKADAVVDYPDKDGIPVAYQEWPLPAFSVGACGTDTYTSNEPFLGATKYIFCNGLTPIWLIGIDGMGHTWTNGTFPTTESIVAFFGLGMPSDVEESDKHVMRRAIAQESSQRLELPWLEHDQTITIIDLTGSTAIVADAESLSSVSLQPGYYTLTQLGKVQATLLIY